MTQEDGFISLRGMLHLLERSAEALHHPDFGLLLSTRQDATILGPIAIAAQYSPTLGLALHNISRYMQVHSPAVRFRPPPG